MINFLKGKKTIAAAIVTLLFCVTGVVLGTLEYQQAIEYGWWAVMFLLVRLGIKNEALPATGTNTLPDTRGPPA